MQLWNLLIKAVQSWSDQESCTWVVLTYKQLNNNLHYKRGNWPITSMYKPQLITHVHTHTHTHTYIYIYIYTANSKMVVLQRYINLKHWARKVRWEFLFIFWMVLLECQPHTVSTYGGEEFGTVELHNKDVKMREQNLGLRRVCYLQRFRFSWRKWTCKLTNNLHVVLSWQLIKQKPKTSNSYESQNAHNSSTPEAR